MYIYQTMSNSFGYLDIILLGMIAGFIILRLRSILGRKTGHESKVYPNFAEKKFSMPKNDAEPSKQNLEVLEGKDKKEFLRGAEIAYESVMDVYNSFKEKVINGRETLDDINQLDEIALGRVWSGKEAKLNGLIDEIGGLHDAINISKESIGINSQSEVNIIEYPERQPYFVHLIR